jgi:hypothetical protein
MSSGKNTNLRQLGLHCSTLSQICPKYPMIMGHLSVISNVITPETTISNYQGILESSH